jgi:ankyrin repeat protein
MILDYCLFINKKINILLEEVIAIIARRKNLVEFLLDRGANIHEVLFIYPNDKVPYLQIASKKGYLEIVEVLLDRGADVDEQSELTEHWTVCRGPWTSVQSAIYNGHKDVVKLLLERGASTSFMDDNE